MHLLVWIVICFMLSVFHNGTVRAEITYQFGAVPQYEPVRLRAIWKPILHQLETDTGLKFELVGTRDIPSFDKAFLSEEYDLAYVNPYHALQAMETLHYVPLIRDGGRELYGIIVVRKDDPINSIKELENEVIAFPAPNALGASLIIRTDLHQLGIKFKPLYAQTHTSVYFNVFLSEARAGGGVMSTFKQQTPAIRDNLRVLYETRRMTPHPVMAHPRVIEAHRILIINAFINMATTPIGKQLLDNIPILQPIKATKADYRNLSEWQLEKMME